MPTQNIKPTPRDGQNAAPKPGQRPSEGASAQRSSAYQPESNRMLKPGQYGTRPEKGLVKK